MIGNFRKRLWARETLIGSMVTLPMPAIAEILADLGFDWLFIDGEHGPLGTTEILAILQAVGDRVACIVRVPGSEEAPIKKILDQGAEGIIVPQVNTVEQAASVVRYARYAPAGSRSRSRASPRLRDAVPGIPGDGQRASGGDRSSRAARAVENIESIVKVEGIDAVLLGPYDLAASLGKMGRIDDPVVSDAIEHVTRTCRAAGIPTGYFGVSAAAIRPYMEQGYTMIAAGVDTLFLAGAAKRLLEELRMR